MQTLILAIFRVYSTASINEDDVERFLVLGFLSKHHAEFQNSAKWEPLKSSPAHEVSMANHEDLSLGMFSKHPFQKPHIQIEGLVAMFALLSKPLEGREEP